MPLERRLAAILAADVVGYSRLMGQDEAGTLARLKGLRRELVQPRITEGKGRIVKLMGDGLLAEFPSVVEAVRCAAAIQEAMRGREPDLSEGERIKLRIGVNLGDIIVEGTDLYGDGVNVAARLEGLAEPGGICISGPAFDAIDGKLHLPFEDIGARQVKNIAKPVRVYRLAGLGRPDAPARAGPAPPLPDKPSIAVLPFANLSDDSEQEYFSDGITEDIITELSRVRELFVIARNSSFHYKGRTPRIEDVGRELGVQYVLEGSVRKAGRRVRVTVQLIEAASGNHIWAERYDRELANIFDLQDDITRSVVTVLPLHLQGALRETAKRKPSENLTAYDYFLRGRWLYERSSGRNAEALRLLERAVELDPSCAHAYASIALAYAYSVFTFSPMSADPTVEARANIERALATGEGNAFIHAMAAEVYLICGEHDLAGFHVGKALALNPNDIVALRIEGNVRAYSGDPSAGVVLLTKALRYDPQSPDSYSEVLAESLYMLSEYEKAIAVYKRWRDPPVHMYTHLAACYAQVGRMDEAAAAASYFREHCPPDADFGFYAKAHARICKRPSDAQHWMEGYRKAGLLA